MVAYETHGRQEFYRGNRLRLGLGRSGLRGLALGRGRCFLMDIGTSSTETLSKFSYEDILKSIAEIEKIINETPMPPVYNFGGIGLRIFENSFCDQLVPVRKHIKRRTQSEKYHQRIQKKWIKRFGRKPESVAYLFNGEHLGMGQALVAGPRAISMIRNIQVAGGAW